jgi:hypothetical protein
MTDQALYRTRLAGQPERIDQQAQVPMVTLWSQLGTECQIQLAQRLAELIQRIRKAACQEKNSHEGA